MRIIILIVATALAMTGLTLAVPESSKAKGSGKQTASTGGAQHKVISPSEMTWGEAPPGLPPGRKMAVPDGDSTKTGSFTVRLQSPDGYKIAPHTHPTAELITVISGTLHLGEGEKFDETAGHEMVAGSILPGLPAIPSFRFTAKDHSRSSM